MDSKEIEISVPWGTIAAKTWGSDSNPIVLFMHGLLDNAGSFDYLIPTLVQHYYYVSIDLPGHGRSSHLPSFGTTLQAADYVYVVKLVTDHFAREKYIMIGHSFGAVLAMQFGLVYPEKLDRLFVLDTIWFQIVGAAEFASWTRNKFEECVKINDQIRRRDDFRATRKEALDMILNWRYTNCELTPRSAEALLERSIVECPGGKYKLTRDLRVRNYMCYPVDETYASEILKSHKFTYKVVTIITEFCEKKYNELYPKLLAAFKDVGEWFVIKGNHHVHLNNPENVSRIINNFLDD